MLTPRVNIATRWDGANSIEGTWQNTKKNIFKYIDMNFLQLKVITMLILKQLILISAVPLSCVFVIICTYLLKPSNYILIWINAFNITRWLPQKFIYQFTKTALHLFICVAIWHLHSILQCNATYIIFLIQIWLKDEKYINIYHKI